MEINDHFYFYETYHGSCSEFNLYSNPPPTSTPTPKPTPTIILVDYLQEGYWSSYRINDRSGWKVTANNEHSQAANAVEGPVRNIIDGNRRTYWHTRWGTNEEGNHDDRPGNTESYQITIDLGKETTFRAFSYTPREKGNEGWQNGNIQNYEFYVANSKEELDNKVQNNEYLSKGTFEYTKHQTSTDKTSLVIYGVPETGRFISLLYVDPSNYHGSCSEFNLYSDPLVTPPMTPSSSMTPPPTEPEKIPGPTYIENKDCDTNGRVERVINQTEPIMLTINVSLFENIDHNDDGGAIHVINAGIQCDGNIFRQCTSTKAGGAIYVKNDYDFLNQLTFVNLEINKCTAEYGGGIFISTTSNKHPVIIKACKFDGNTALTKENENNEFYGGSAIFLMVPSGLILKNKFTNNIGDGGSIRIRNVFESKKSSMFMLSYNDDADVLINDCIFEISKNEKYSVFYDSGNKGSLFKLNKCTFTGKLSPGSNYIGGRVVSNNSPKLVVKMCKFDIDLKNWNE